MRKCIVDRLAKLDLRVSGVGRIDLHVGRPISQRVRLCVSGLFEQE